MTNTEIKASDLFIVYNAAGVSEMFHSEIVKAILAGGTLPEELADLITLVPVEGFANRWRVDFA